MFPVDQGLGLQTYRCGTFALNYLDKTTLSYASVMGLQKDIHLRGAEYQWLGSMFYVGYLVFEVSIFADIGIYT